MSIWSRIAQALSALASGEPLARLFERLRTPPERSVAFTIAVIALGAKMAKADGHVTRDEVRAFRRVFLIPPGEEENAARVFNLARQDVAGFADYARRVRAMFGAGDPVLFDLMEGLFYIAVADGSYHPEEEDFLARVAEIFEIGQREFRAMRARFVEGAEPDPYDVLGVDPGAPMPEIRSAWHRLVRENHPDRMIARGVPEEAVKLAESRLIAINRAWEEISDRAA
ncbi:molecular chaperone DjiA [Poseidonocella sp. HB161398]|uniref:molecular chaperone DjiA n=1 Tax=Poseidonocella sp. HB161398 TaxID=2320855 RepID=UPI001109F573|nr:molecular chaperone DjiA [Poseidonocella sp. HB161398]